jgi:SAM-dependent methyltransferase
VASSEEFWNRVFREAQSRPSDPHDSVLGAALEHFDGNVARCRLLDLGTGLGEASLFFAARGASVVSVDTSDVAVSNLSAYCVANEIANVTPMQMNAAEIANIGTFDFIFGSMILHHIEPFEEFAAILRDALRPEGKAFFYENSAMSSLLIWLREHVVGRLGISKYGDEEEFPLTLGEVQTLSKYFDTEVVYPELLFFRLIPTYIFRGRGERPFRLLDDLFYRVPRFRQYSYRQYILLS